MRRGPATVWMAAADRAAFPTTTWGLLGPPQFRGGLDRGRTAGHSGGETTRRLRRSNRHSKTPLRTDLFRRRRVVRKRARAIREARTVCAPVLARLLDEDTVPPHQSASGGKKSRDQSKNRPKGLSSAIETAKMQAPDPVAEFTTEEKVESRQEDFGK